MSYGVSRSAPHVLLALALLAPLSADAFATGEVYWGPGSCGTVCGLFDVTLGGNQSAASPFAIVDRVPGQIGWTASPPVAYVSEFDLDRVVQVDAAGAVVTFATGLAGATGLLVDTGSRILAASFDEGAVYDISAGGDFSAASPFASGLRSPRNLLELSTGEILVADQSPLARAVFDITAGGDFTAATPFAFGFAPDGPYDLTQDGSGKIYASTDAGVFDITAGGNFASAMPHASGQLFVGLTVDGAGRLLASVLTSGDIYDITAGGDFSSATPFAAQLDGAGDSALDTVPAGLQPLPVPALPPAMAGLLGGLLSLGGAARLRAMGFVR